MELGIDISVHNGIVNMHSVKTAGYNRLFMRAGYGKNNIDQKYIINAEACRTVALNGGIYWFSYGYNTAMAKAEGQYALAAAGKYWDKCPVAFDLEYDTVSYARKNGVEITKALATDMAIAFLEVVVNGGFIPVLYTNKDYMDNYFDIEQIKNHFAEKVYIWYARYTNSLNSSEMQLADIWQKSSTGKVNGINGNVDINEFYTEFNDVKPKPADKEKGQLDVKYFQLAANNDGFRDYEGQLLQVDGINGAKTQFVCKQVCLMAKPSGSSYITDSTGNLVTWWQGRLMEMGFHVDVDGLFGGDTREQTIAFQNKYQLAPDGIAGYNSISAMLFY